MIERSNYGPGAAKRLIGQLMLELGLVIPQDLEFALEHQKYSKNLIGEILIRMGAINRNDLDVVIAKQLAYLVE